MLDKLKMKTSELIFMPAPYAGHLSPMLDLAKILINRYQTLSITVLIVKLPFDTGVNAYIESLYTSPTPRLTLIELPPTDPSTYMSESFNTIFYNLMETQKEHVRDVVQQILSSKSTRLAGFFVDMFCVTVIDVADEFKVPVYVYFAASAAFLGLMFYLQRLRDELKKDVAELDKEVELLVPSLRCPLPCELLPSIALDKEGGCDVLLLMAKRFRESKGILVNTFMELEPYATESLMGSDLGKIPPVYPVGPVLNFRGVGQNSDETSGILRWLDDQPVASVVFLCFGSMGSISDEQAKEIAVALERSNLRFLWSLKPPLSTGSPKQSHYKPKDILPLGFLERTAGLGKVVEWAPQVAVLSHVAVGGFVSHCGWNSILESTWFGVPIATLPLYAEQQLNAFEMVVEYGIALDIKMDYRNEFDMKNSAIVEAEEIESKIRELMMDINGNELRKKVKDVSVKSRSVVLENGSSYASIRRIMEEII